MAAPLGGRPRRLRRHGLVGREVLHAQHVPVPLGQPPARGPRPQLHPRRRPLPAPADGRTPSAEPDGLGRVRIARGERGDPERRASPRVHAVQHRADEGAALRARLSLRLVQGARLVRPGLLPVEPVAVPPDVGARARASQDRAGQLVPGLPHRPRQRAGRRRALRALGRSRGDPGSHAVVLQGHRLRREAARRARPPSALVRSRQDDAAQLDREVGGGRGRLPHRRARRAPQGLHDPAGHAPRGDLPGARAGASGRRASGRPRSPPRRDRGVRRTRAPRVAPRA